jgi:hypothetical protein
LESLDRLFGNTATDRVVRFQISGPGAGYYNHDYALTWKEEPNRTIIFTPDQQVNIRALTPVEDAPLYAIDSLNKRQVSSFSTVFVDSTYEEAVTILGWAVDPKSRKEAAEVFVDIDGLDIRATYHQKRRDVAEFEHNTDYIFSGFSASFPTSLISKGKHTLSLKIVTSGKDGYYQPPQKITFEVK